jgi:hypothetical protein
MAPSCWGILFTAKVILLIWTKHVLGDTLCHFFTNTSGHPGHCWHYRAATHASRVHADETAQIRTPSQAAAIHAWHCARFMSYVSFVGLSLPPPAARARSPEQRIKLTHGGSRPEAVEKPLFSRSGENVFFCYLSAISSVALNTNHRPRLREWKGGVGIRVTRRVCEKNAIT